MSSDNRPTNEIDKPRSASGPATIQAKNAITRKASTQQFDDMLKNLDVLCDETKRPSQSGSAISLLRANSAGGSSLSRMTSSSIFAQMTEDLDAHIHRPFSGSSSINSSRQPSITRMDSSSRLTNSRNPTRQDSINRSDIPIDISTLNTILNTPPGKIPSEGVIRKNSKKNERVTSGQSFVVSPKAPEPTETSPISGVSPPANLPFDLNLPVDEKIITPQYMNALSAVMNLDSTMSTLPTDFLTNDGYQQWQKTVDQPFQVVIHKILTERYSSGKDRAKVAKKASGGVVIELFFKIVEARGLLAKEGKTRDAYCTVQFAAAKGDEKRKDKDLLFTEVIQGTNSPVWNQHMNIPARNLTDRVIITVMDKRKDDCLGQIIIPFGELITLAARDGYLRKWYPLNPREGKKDKFIGGELYIEAGIPTSDETRPKSDEDLTFNYIQAQIVNCRVNLKSLYKILLRNCLLLDLRTNADKITSQTTDLLSEESKTLFRVFGKQWAISNAYFSICYLELLFDRYKCYEIPTNALLFSLEDIHSMKRNSDWLSEGEKMELNQLLSDMYDYYQTQISKYREFFPKNQPRGALEATIFMLRIIHKYPLYRELHPQLQESFREELRLIMNEASVSRYQKLQELCAPFDENDTVSVLESMKKLAEMLSEEIESDVKYYQKPFARELDIVRLTAENYLKYFVLSLENSASLLSSPKAIQNASQTIFALYKRLRVMDERYGKLVPGLKHSSMSAGFNIEKWFAPFVNEWLLHLSTLTLTWVENAVKLDKFEPVQNEEHQTNHSSSVTDLFSAVFSELEMIVDLGWNNVLQRAGFFQLFAKAICHAVEQYCGAIAIGETRLNESFGTSAWKSFTEIAGRSSSVSKMDITSESCVKLCNIEYAISRLDEMYRAMNVSSLVQSQKDYRASMIPSGPTQDVTHFYEKMGAIYKVQVCYGEDLKPCNKNGLSNPYVIFRVSEGTEAAPTIQAEQSYFSSLLAKSASLSGNLSGALSGRSDTVSSSPHILKGKECELLKTRTVNDTINPSWDESFDCLIPPTEYLQIDVYSRNLLTSDEIIGQCKLAMNESSNLRKRLMDHQTYDIYLDLEPQGRVLVRLSMEGQGENVDFWFKRAKGTLLRTRNDFIRALTSKISPNAKEMLLKTLKEHEAIVLPSKSFFTSMTAPTQYGTMTSNSIPINQAVNAQDADTYMAPLAEYLNKNLEILCALLSPQMAQEVIKRIWNDILGILELALVPKLFGSIEKDRRILNPRQVSMVMWQLKILRDFFHADGEGLGLSMDILQTPQYEALVELLSIYHQETATLKDNHSTSMKQGQKELILRLLRLRMERPEHEVTVEQKEEEKTWFEGVLNCRKEHSKQ